MIPRGGNGADSSAPSTSGIRVVPCRTVFILEGLGICFTRRWICTLLRVAAPALCQRRIRDTPQRPLSRFRRQAESLMSQLQRQEQNKSRQLKVIRNTDRNPLGIVKQLVAQRVVIDGSQGPDLIPRAPAHPNASVRLSQDQPQGVLTQRASALD